MKLNYNFFYALIALFFISSCANSNTTHSDNSSAEWASEFVVWNDYIYQLSDIYVENIAEEIGEVTNYSDIEGTYSGNFSNTYEKGTKYYAIQGVSTEEAIAIEEDGRYKKAIRDGIYGEK